MNGQLPGFGGSKESEESTTELKEEATEAPNNNDKHEDVFHTEDVLHVTEDITSNVWADPDVEVFTTENVNSQTDADSTTQDDQIKEVTTDVSTDFMTTTENDQTTTNVPGGLEVAPVVAEFDSDNIVTDVEEGVWNNPDGSNIGGDQQDNLLPDIDIQPVVAEEEESTTNEVEVPPATAASVVEEVEEDAWTDPEDQSNSLLPQIEPVVAETTTSESFTSDDSTTESDVVSTSTMLTDDSTQVTTEENEIDNEETTTEAKGVKTSENLSDGTTEVPVHLFDDDIEDQTPLETIIDFLSETTADFGTTSEGTSNTESSTEAMDSTTTVEDLSNSEMESTTGNSDPTLDYDMQQDKIGVTEQIETTLFAEAFDDDLDNFDKISVVTSMSLSDNGNNVEEETDEVTVVTASPAAQPPVPSLDDLDLIDSSIQDVFTTGVEVTTESMSTEETTRSNMESMSTEETTRGNMEITETTRGEMESTEAVTDTSLSTLELLQDFDFLGDDNGFIHNAFVTTGATTLQNEVYNAVSDTTETDKEMLSESVSTMGDSLETTTDSITVNSEAPVEEIGTTEFATDVTTAETEVDTSTSQSSQVIFRDDETVGTSTYFPVTGGEIQEDDLYEDLTDLEVAALVSDVIFEETTTGSSNQLFAFEAVEADTEVIFDETTTPGPVQEEEVVPVNFGDIEAVEADYNEDVEDSNQVFDETTTGGPLLVVQPVLSEEEEDGFFVENVENEVWSDPENPKKQRASARN